jgi:beta-phosphoglucomutase-like phosphatase (HAD superfamily)
MSIKLVVFDIAGTTIQDEIGVMAAFQSTLKKHGYEVPMEDIAPVMGYKKIEAIKFLLYKHDPDNEKLTLELVETIHNDFVNHMVNFYQTTPEIEVFPHT